MVFIFIDCKCELQNLTDVILRLSWRRITASDCKREGCVFQCPLEGKIFFYFSSLWLSIISEIGHKVRNGVSEHKVISVCVYIQGRGGHIRTIFKLCVISKNSTVFNFFFYFTMLSPTIMPHNRSIICRKIYKVKVQYQLQQQQSNVQSCPPCGVALNIYGAVLNYHRIQ